MDNQTNGSTLPTESVAVTTNGGSHAPAKTAAPRQPPIGRAEVRELARVIAKELGHALQRLDKLEAATGLSKTASLQPGVEAVAPVIRDFIEARLRSLEATVHDLDETAQRYAGTYRHGKTYKGGQTVSFRGGLWLALGATDTKPGTGDWKLVVKSGAFGPRDETRTDDQ